MNEYVLIFPHGAFAPPGRTAPCLIFNPGKKIMCENHCSHDATIVKLRRGEAIVIRNHSGSVRIDDSAIYVTSALPIIFDSSPCKRSCADEFTHSPCQATWGDLPVAKGMVDHRAEKQAGDDWRAPVSGFDVQPGYAHFVDFESNSASGEGEIPSS